MGINKKDREKLVKIISNRYKKRFKHTSLITNECYLKKRKKDKVVMDRLHNGKPSVFRSTLVLKE